MGELKSFLLPLGLMVLLTAGLVFGIDAACSRHDKMIEEQTRQEIVSVQKDTALSALQNATEKNDQVLIKWADDTEIIRISSKWAEEEVRHAQSDALDIDAPLPDVLGRTLRLRAEGANRRICARNSGNATTICAPYAKGGTSAAGKPDGADRR